MRSPFPAPDEGLDEAAPTEDPLPDIATPRSITRRAVTRRLAVATGGVFSRVSRQGSEGRHGQRSVKAKLLVAVGCKCEACGVCLPAPGLLHVHHAVPVARGGASTVENCILVCPTCHAKAHWIDRHLTERERPRTRTELVSMLVRVAHLS